MIIVNQKTTNRAHEIRQEPSLIFENGVSFLGKDQTRLYSFLMGDGNPRICFSKACVLKTYSFSSDQGQDLFVVFVQKPNFFYLTSAFFIQNPNEKKSLSSNVYSLVSRFCREKPNNSRKSFICHELIFGLLRLSPAYFLINGSDYKDENDFIRIVLSLSHKNVPTIVYK
jgi:hypothetical protein